jgi:hypothetical protein
MRALLLALLIILPIASLAQASKPLVVLRFNQPRVAYEQPLYDAVARAVAIKPQVVFDVISYAPTTGDPRTDQAWQTTAGHNAQTVVTSLQGMGVPLSRIRLSGQQQPGLGFDEVHVYVR